MDGMHKGNNLQSEDVCFDFRELDEHRKFIYEAFKAMPSSICVVDGELYSVIDGSDQMLKDISVFREQLDQSLSDQNFKLKNEELKIQLIKSIQSKGYVNNLVCDAYAKGKGSFKAEISAKRFYFKDRPYVVITSTDISEKLNFKKNLINDYLSLTEVENLIDYSDCILFRIKNEPDFAVEYVSENIKNLGIIPDQFYEQKLYFRDIIHPDDRVNWVTNTLRLTFLNTQKMFHDIPIRVKRKDGHYSSMYARCWYLKDELGKITHIQVVLKERKNAFNTVDNDNAEGLESLGVLAGGIAHDFNNLLASIWGRVSVAKRILKSNEKAVRMLNGAEQAVEQAKELTQQLLTFSKGGTPVKKMVDINHLVQSRVELSLRGTKIGTQFVLPEKSLSTEVDIHQINQVVNNVISNSMQAMSGEGQVIVAIEKSNPKTDTYLFDKTGNFIKITINDFGVGIPGFELEKVFEPYYSTKEKGSGLGLTICRSIIEKHGGKFIIESSYGVGTIAKIYLPLTQDLKEEVLEEDGSNNSIARILIMDDDDLVRSFLEDALEELGYDVVATSEGEKAIEVYKQYLDSGHKFDVTIMDLTVPGGMGGQKAMEELLKIDPAIKALVSSGYSNDLVMAEYEKFGFVGVMVKPYNLEQLSDSIEQLLGVNEAHQE